MDILETLRHEPQVSRLRMLQDNADDIREGYYYYDFTDEELAELKEANTQADIELANLAAERKRLIEPLDKAIKEVKASKAATLANIMQGREQRHGETFIFHDEDEMKTYTLDHEARIIAVTPLLKKQKTIYEPIRKAVNQ